MAPIQKKMKLYPENKCRLCTKTFCCQECRMQHEEQFHKVNPDCEICIYGRMTIKNASVLLLSHIKAVHWPLHCVFCKKVFSTLDELVPHEKCFMKPEALKMQATPKTPVTPVSEQNEVSPMVTPFYKTSATGNLMVNTNASSVVTSTPLVHKEEIGDGTEDKITPINNSDVKFIYKSNLKLTGSSNLSDSKKSERRVTFSETPSVSEVNRIPKCLPLQESIPDNPPESAANSANSVGNSYSIREENEIIETASSPETFDDDNENKFKIYCSADTFSEEKENIENQSACKNDSDTTDWASALTNSRFDSTDHGSNHFNLSVQINVFNESLKNEKSSGDESQNKSVSLWSSMTNIVKSVVTNISLTAHNSLSSTSIKRAKPDSDFHAESPCYKRMKLTDLKCRRSIRDLSPLRQIRLATLRYVDKATQTDESWL